MKKWIEQYSVELGLYVGITLLSLLLLQGPWVPQVFPEEAGYLGWANRMLYGQGSGNYFLPGYSLILLPLMAISNDITVIYPYLLVQNVLLNGLFVVGLYRLTQLWGCSKKEGIIGAAVIALYAPFVIYTQKVICEPLLNVCGVWLVLAIHQAFEKRNKKGRVLIVLLSLLMMLTHSREFVLVGVLLLMILWCSSNPKGRWITIFSVCVIGGICLLWVLSDNGTTTLHFKRQLGGLLSFHGLYRWGITLVTQSTYCILSTFGLAPAGIWYGIHVVRQKKEGWQAALFSLLFFGATALLSAFFMSHHSKAVQLVYGRYNDGAMAGIVVLGVLSYLRKRPPLWLWGICLGNVFVTAVLYREMLRNLTGDIMNALGLYLSRLFLWEFDLWIILLVFGCIGVVFWACQRKRPLVGLYLLGALFLFQLGYLVNTLFMPDANQPHPALLQTLDRLEQEDLALYKNDGYVREYYRLSVYRPALSASNTQGQIEISKSWREDNALLDAQKGTFLWARGEETKKKYEDLILPMDGSVTQPSSKITLVEAGEEAMKVRVENTGSPWLCLSAVGDVQKAVRMGVRMFDRTGALIGEQRVDFEKNMRLGDWQEVSVLLPEQAHVVSFELLQEFKDWFSQLGDEGRLTVDRQGRPAALPPVDQGFHTLYPEFLIHMTESESLPYRNNLEGFYDTWTGANSSFRHLKINCQGKQELVLETEQGDKYNPTLIITLNDSYVLEPPVYEQGNYLFSLGDFDGEITSITLTCTPTNPFVASGWPKALFFLSLDSHIRPVQLAVHGIRKVFGVDVNNHDFGVNVKRIEIK